MLNVVVKQGTADIILIMSSEDVRDRTERIFASCHASTGAPGQRRRGLAPPPPQSQKMEKGEVFLRGIGAVVIMYPYVVVLSLVSSLLVSSPVLYRLVLSDMIVSYLMYCSSLFYRNLLY